MSKRSVYLDYAAATPMDPKVLQSMQPFLVDNFYNPSASYQAARDVKSVLENSRKSVAEILGAKASEIIFTAGGTEANNLAITGIMKNYPKSKLVISAIEHPSVNEPASYFNHATCPVDSKGLVDLTKLESLIDDQTVLVSIIYVNNEIGVIEPISAIARLLDSIKQDRLERGLNLPLYFHSDACQAANYLDLHVARLGVDLMTLNGGKIYGPKQSAVLMVKSDVSLSPIITGGGQERNIRSGTENVSAIVGFASALKLAQDSRKQNTEAATKLQDYFAHELTNAFPEAAINGSMTKRIANNLHVTFKGIDNEWLLIKLDELGIMAAAGSACSAAKGKPSTVLAALGLSDKDSKSSIRFSFGNKTTKSDIDYLINSLKELL
jgi:cysteine desulfurase